jgi:hypothetical protein
MRHGNSLGQLPRPAAAVLDALALPEPRLRRFRQALAGEAATLNALLQLGKSVRGHPGDGPVV